MRYDSDTMKENVHLKALKEYIANTKEILSLSSPMLAGIENDEDYRLKLLSSFREIGVLSQRNNEILDAHFFPLVLDEKPSGKEVREALRTFNELLLDSTAMENIDQPLLMLIAEKLLSDAERGEDERELILALDGMVPTAYIMWNLTTRLAPVLMDCYRYRDMGFQAAKRLIALADKERFLQLPDDECRQLVLINTRYVRCMFSWEDKEDRAACNESDLEMMRHALALAKDPFYREQIPDDAFWDSHVFRTLQYLADFTEDCNSHGFTKEQLRELNDYAKQLFAFLSKHSELQNRCPFVEQQLYRLRNAYLSEELSLDAYREALAALILRRDPEDFSTRGLYTYYVLPWEYILSLDPKHLSPEETQTLQVIYDAMSSYAYRMPKTGVLSFMLTMICNILQRFIAVPDGISFPDLCLSLMAAMHPPTYIHSIGVADIALFLATHLLEKNPAPLVGIAGTADVSEVPAQRESVLNFVHEAARLHDIGKLFIVETIITYGRRLIDDEFALIREHPAAGAALLKTHPETAPYAEASLYHHRWFDNSRGYPEPSETDVIRYPALNALVEISDCIDAATDAVGRNYKQGKDLSAVLEELRAERGTHYAPYLVDLFDDPAVFEGVERLIAEGRDENYRKTYHLLKSL